ncbi:MAG: Translation initiation factor IF-3 [Verrucomicrobia bacterium ADurb.Bin474]|nr:MAG: Translation initiation factor IF-3 [Verrucomicrobia bacterium ADurb.Bin474]
MAQYPRSSSYNRRQSAGSSVRKNERIRASEVRVIGPDGKQLGVMNPADAMRIAKGAGLDLVEVSPTAKPPVCRILDFGKYMYELSKKQKESKSNAAVTKVKEIKLRVSIDTHDYMTKVRRAEQFLNKGNKLKISLQFRGRENEHRELGFETVKRAIEDLNHIGNPDADPRLVGRSVSVSLSPLPATKRKLKYSTGDEPEEEDDGD